MLPWADAAQGEAVTEQLSYRSEGEDLTECAVQKRMPPLRPHRDQHDCRDRADAGAALAGQHRLAFALVHKYVDGTPVYRLAQTFERACVPVSRGALGTG